MREAVFHKLWESCSFSAENLRTVCGKSVELCDVGRLNHGDGPDFNNARVRLDGLSLHGSVELHLSNKDWYLHHHDSDPRYNNVILHVVLHPKDAKSVQLQDGTSAPTLVLFEHMHAKWQKSIQQLTAENALACSGFLKNIAPSVIKRQLNDAATQYFAVKRSDLLQHYDTSLPPSEAWLKMFYVAWCDGLGISNNRSAMSQLAAWAWHKATSNAFDALTEELMEAAGLRGSGKNAIMKRIQWDYSGGRPSNYPAVRIKQAAHMLLFIREFGLSPFLHSNPNDLQRELDTSCFGGKHRTSILLFSVFLPAIHILGNLFTKDSLCNFAMQQWHSQSFPVPDGIFRGFSVAGRNQKLFKNHIGTVYQQRHLCKSNGCEQCFVFKSLIKG
jgi:hypothetical protein